VIAIVYIVGAVVLASFAFANLLDARIRRERDGAAFPTARTRRRS
jgi:hypothetical protein